MQDETETSYETISNLDTLDAFVGQQLIRTIKGLLEKIKKELKNEQPNKEKIDKLFATLKQELDCLKQSANNLPNRKIILEIYTILKRDLDATEKLYEQIQIIHSQIPKKVKKGGLTPEEQLWILYIIREDTRVGPINMGIELEKNNTRIRLGRIKYFLQKHNLRNAWQRLQAKNNGKLDHIIKVREKKLNKQTIDKQLRR